MASYIKLTGLKPPESRALKFWECLKHQRWYDDLDNATRLVLVHNSGTDACESKFILA
jgi:hypothetical protein